MSPSATRSNVRRRPLRIAAVLALSGAAALVVAELVLRAFPDLLPPEAELRLTWQSLESPESHTIADPVVGYLHKPNTVRTVERSDLAFTFATDGHGFRNPWPWPERADVVAVGDSMTYGFGVDDDELWTRAVGAELGLTVINLGIDGAAPQQYERVYETFGSGLAPRLVLFGLFPGNDARDTRLFDDWLADGGEGNYAVYRHFGGRVPGARRGLRALVESSYLLTGLRALLEHRPGSGGLTHELADGCRLRLVPGILADSIVTDPADPIFRRMMETTLATRDAAAADGARFLVLLFPTKEEVWLPVLGRPCPDAVGPFRTALESAGVPCLDLTPALHERAAAGEVLYFEIDGHPNARGCEVIAAAVARHLAEHAAELGLARR